MLLISSQSTGRRRRSGDSLLVDLISWWSLDETSGTRLDLHGSNHLTDNNTVGSAAGKVVTAASFASASSEYLSHASNVDLSLPNSKAMTIALWVYLEALPGTNPTYIAKRGSVLEYQVSQDNAGFSFWRGGTVIRTGGGLPTHTWYCVFAWRDPVANRHYLQVDNGTPVSAASPGVTPTTDLFAIGRAGSLSVGYANGLIDEPAMWSRVLTDAERERYRNNGNGIAYPG